MSGRLFETVGDPALGQIIGGHFNQHLVTSQNTNTVFPHFASRMGNDLMIIFQLDPEHRIGQQFADHAREFEKLFLRHAKPFSVAPPSGAYREGRTLIEISRFVNTFDAKTLCEPAQGIFQSVQLRQTSVPAAAPRASSAANCR